MVESTAAPGRRKPFGEHLELVIFDGGALRRLPLARGAEITVGRGEEASVRVDDPSVSRVHARFRGGAPATLEDLGSSNGTRVGGVKLAPNARVSIAQETIIVLGELSIVVREGRSAEAPAPPSIPEGTMDAVHRLVELVAPSDLSVLVLGETGVGKEVISRAIHERSRRRSAPLLLLNCAAIPEQMLESELFGYEKGAFTGATAAKPGLLESANGGTVLLDEIGDLPLAVQAKLLRALDASEIIRLGSLRTKPIDIRVIAATNRDLTAMVEGGSFRADLLYRLDGMTIHVPPLRERRREIRPLAQRFADEACARAGNPKIGIGKDALAVLEAHDWPGNVRELRKVIERAIVLAAGSDLDATHVVLRSTKGSVPPPPPAVDLREGRERAEIAAIEEALAACRGNQTRAAAKLGISRRTLIERLDKYAMPRPRKL